MPHDHVDVVDDNVDVDDVSSVPAMKLVPAIETVPLVKMEATAHRVGVSYLKVCGLSLVTILSAPCLPVGHLW